LQLQDDESYWPWLVLHLTPGVGGTRGRHLLEQYGTAAALHDLSTQDLVAIGWPQRVAQQVRAGLADPWVQVPGFKRLQQWAAQPGNRILTPAQALYPERLLAILHDPPPVLFMQGDAALLQRPMVAMVGSRQPLPANRHLAHDWAAELARASLVILSGLAQGIDGAAHRGALTGQGSTVAILGSGSERIYPLAHTELARNIIASGGLIMSELAPDTPPSPGQFPRRNRLVAALADVVLVVEAAHKSGSLITARLAADYGKEVLAVPGHPNHSGCAGTNQLIANGAGLAASAADVAAAFSGIELIPTSKAPLNLAPIQRQLLATLTFEPMALETIALEMGQSSAQLLAPLLELELAGCVATVGGSYVRL
jgi:DNA processing protein